MLKGWTQHDLSQRVGCSEAFISKVETGRANPERDLKEQIARVLEISTIEVGVPSSCMTTPCASECELVHV